MGLESPAEAALAASAMWNRWASSPWDAITRSRSPFCPIFPEAFSISLGYMAPSIGITENCFTKLRGLRTVIAAPTFLRSSLATLSTAVGLLLTSVPRMRLM